MSAYVTFDGVHYLEAAPCGCPQNQNGDIRCHVCGEMVNECCWQCGTLRGEGPCLTVAERIVERP